MKPIYLQLSLMAVSFVGMASLTNTVRAQSTEGPANPPVYACVDSNGLLATGAHLQASLPCVPPLTYTKSQVGQPSQTVFTASFNADGTLALPSALSGPAAYNSGDGVYTITFAQPFSTTPACTVTLDGNNAPGLQIEEFGATASGTNVAIQSVANGYTAAPGSFFLLCSVPQ